jgi:hypothetical protein
MAIRGRSIDEAPSIRNNEGRGGDEERAATHGCRLYAIVPVYLENSIVLVESVRKY